MTSCDKDEVASLIPQFQSLKHGLQKHKQHPTSLGTTVVEGKYTKTSNDSDDDGENVLVSDSDD